VADTALIGGQIVRGRCTAEGVGLTFLLWKPRLLALVLARRTTQDRQRRSPGAMPVRLGGGLPVTTRRPPRRRDRRRGGGSGRSVKADIGDHA
jgi:hypothetical protein